MRKLVEQSDLWDAGVVLPQIKVPPGEDSLIFSVAGTRKSDFIDNTLDCIDLFYNADALAGNKFDFSIL